MDHVWQYSFYSDTSTVTVHIRRLRAKLEPDPARPRFIQTVWGRLPVRAVRRAALAASRRRRWGRGSAIAWPSTAATPLWPALEILAPLGGATALLADVIANRHAAWAGCAALGALAMLVAALLAVAVALFAALMFVSPPRRLLHGAGRGLRRPDWSGAAWLVRGARYPISMPCARRSARWARARAMFSSTCSGSDELAALAAEVEAMVARWPPRSGPPPARGVGLPRSAHPDYEPQA